MYRKLSCLIVIILIVVFSSVSIKYTKLNEHRYINVEVKGEVYNSGTYSISLGSTFNDLLKEIKLKDDACIDSISLNQVLYNNQIINIDKRKMYDLISINSASIDVLASLPGIGKSIALRIVEYRDKYGSFTSLDELKNISGIGDKKYEKIKEYITL